MNNNIKNTTNQIVEIFKKIFKKKDLKATPKEIENYANEFMGILFLNILGKTESLLSTEEVEKVKADISSKDFLNMIQILEKKYSPEDWKMILERNTTDLMKDYLAKVINL